MNFVVNIRSTLILVALVFTILAEAFYITGKMGNDGGELLAMNGSGTITRLNLEESAKLMEEAASKLTLSLEEKNKVNQQQQIISKLSTDISSLEIKNQMLEQQLLAGGGASSDQTALLEDYSRKVKALNEQNSNLERKLSMNEKQFEKEKDKLKQEYAGKLSALSESNSKLESKTAKLENENDKLERRMLVSNKNLESEQKKLIADYASKITNLKSTNRGLEKRLLASKQEVLAEKQKVLDEYTVKVKSLESKNDRLKKELALANNSSEFKIQQLNLEISRLKDELKSTVAKSPKPETAAKAVKASLTTSTPARSATTNKRSPSRALDAALRKDKDALMVKWVEYNDTMFPDLEGKEKVNGISLYSLDTLTGNCISLFFDNKFETKCENIMQKGLAAVNRVLPDLGREAKEYFWKLRVIIQGALDLNKRQEDMEKTRVANLP
ncbi:MAG: hypothetical protein OEZ58_00645 [Gammaproteobacteria bacterium]|nr:hypothetical protein [Gammaproteobacteria bacterium]